MSDRVARGVGVVLAGMSAVLLLACAFARWWGDGQSTTTGWAAIGPTGKLLLLVTLGAGFLALLIVALPARLAPWVAALLSATALGAGAWIAGRLGVRTVGFRTSADANAGPLVAGACCLAIAGAVILSAHGSARWREQIRAPAGLGVLVLCSCVAIVASLFLPWAHYAQAGEAGPRLPSITLTGWQASTGLAWWLVVESVATATAAVVVVVGTAARWVRLAAVALAAAGWLAIVTVTVIPLRAIGLNRLPFGIERSLTTHAPGYYVALSGGLLIMLFPLVWVAIPAPAASEHRRDELRGTGGERG